MHAGSVESGWLQQQTLDGINEISVECDHLDLTVEADEHLSNMVQLVAQPAENAPELTRSGTSLRIKQAGRYRGRVTPMLRVPATGCPATDVKLGKGDVSFRHVGADVVVQLGMGDVEIVEGAGNTAVSLGKGDIAIVDRHGNVALKNGMGDTAVVRCAGAVAISTGKGDIAVSESGPDLAIKTGNGDIAITRMAGGRLTVTAGSGDIGVVDGEASSVVVQTGKGDIASTVRLLTASEPAPSPADGEDDEYSFFDENDEINPGDIHFEASDDGVRLARGSRDILSLGPDGIRIRGSRREISLGPDGIRVGDAGDVSVGSDRFAFETERGDVHVSVPSDLHLRVEVLATGDVQSDVPLVSVGRPGPRGTVKRLVGVADGSGNGARTNVRVRTKRGDVSIRSMRVQRRSAPQPEAVDDRVDRDEQARVILEALARGELSVNEAERLLQGYDSGD